MIDGKQEVVYYASSTVVLARATATKRVARYQPDPLPAMLPGRLAGDRERQSRGLASALLKFFQYKALEVAQHTSIRLVLVHAKDDQAANFYRHYGFEQSPVDELTLLLFVKDTPDYPRTRRLRPGQLP